MNNKAFGVICANYDAKNFGALLEKRTIASLPFGGRYRLVDFPLSAMVHAGIDTVGLIMPYHYRSLIDHVGTGKPWNLDRKIDGLFTLPSEPLAASDMGSRVHLADIIANKRYFQRRPGGSYGVFMATSTISNIDLKPIMEAHEKSGKQITLVCYKNAAGKECRLDLALISRETLLIMIDRYINRPYEDSTSALMKCVLPKDINKYEYTGYVKEINDVSDYIEASFGLLDPKVHKKIFDPERIIYTKTQDEAPALYAKGSSVKNSLVSAGCVIEGSIENCILFRNVTIKKGAVLKNCIVMQHTKIDSDTKLTNCILDKYVKVSSGVSMEGGKERPIIIGKNEEI